MKNKSFNIIMPREKESIARKVKKAKDVHEDPLRRDKKPRVSKGGMSLILLSSLLCKKNGSFPCTMMVFFLRERHFSLSHFPTNFLLFSLMFSPGSCYCSPCSFFFFFNGPTTCSSYSPRNVAKYKRKVSNYDSSI